MFLSVKSFVWNDENWFEKVIFHGDEKLIEMSFFQQKII